MEESKEEIKKYPLTNDIVFKKLFGEDKEETKKSLIFMINNIVKLEGEHKIVEIKILNPYTLSDIDTNEKRAVLDVKAHCQNGTRYNVEMQVNTEKYYSKRALYYWSKLYIEALKKGESYDELSKTIGIHILDFKYYKGDNFHKKHEMYYNDAKQEAKKSFKEIEMHTIELPKLDAIEGKGNSNNSNKSNKEFIDTVEAIAAFLKDPDFLEKNRDKLTSKDYKEFISLNKRYQEIHFTRQERYAIEDRIKAQLDENTRRIMEEKIRKEKIEVEKKLHVTTTKLDAANNQLDAATQERDAANAKLQQTAKNLLSMNMDIIDICKITNLTEKEILHIQKTLNQ